MTKTYDEIYKEFQKEMMENDKLVQKEINTKDRKELSKEFVEYIVFNQITLCLNNFICNTIECNRAVCDHRLCVTEIFHKIIEIVFHIYPHFFCSVLSLTFKTLPLNMEKEGINNLRR